jgi:flagellar basal-body rod protein FlgB
MLIDKLLFSDKVPDLMRKNLDFASSRHLLITTNVTNADTPGYKAHDIDFQSQLREVFQSDGQLSMKKTDGRHFGPSSAAVKALQPEPFEETQASKSNGNNVDMDKEMAKLAENQIRFNATIQLMQKRGSAIRSAITESTQG